MSGPRREAETWSWRELHNEEFYNVYSSTNIIRAMKSRKLRWVAHVVRMRR
jgi:hypothetical protein